MFHNSGQMSMKKLSLFVCVAFTSLFVVSAQNGPKITTPAANAVLSVGSSYTVKWDTTNSPRGTRYYIEYSVTGETGAWNRIKRRDPVTQLPIDWVHNDSAAASAGTPRGRGEARFAFKPTLAGENCYLRLVKRDDPTVIGMSDRFSITPPPKPIKIDEYLPQSIQGNVTIPYVANKVYGLRGYTYVEDGATLTIEPGVVIVSDTPRTNSALCVNRGGKIIARGTKERPIVFTSSAPAGQRRTGDWGGLLICGKARINVKAGEAALEGGIAAASPGKGWYGGTDDNDNSGVLEYVRIEFAGIAAFPNEELNSLTLGAVGRGTTINHVQCTHNGDDAFEWFGGTVDAKHLVSNGTVDDDFDTDFGFSGRIQFGVAQRYREVADQSTSQCFESDNDGTGTYNLPRTHPIFSNMTLVGPIDDTSRTSGSGTEQWNALYGSAAQVRRNSHMSLINSVFVGFPRAGYELRGARTLTAASKDSLLVRNNAWFGIKGGGLSVRLESGESAVEGMNAAWLLESKNANSITNGTGAVSSYAPFAGVYVRDPEKPNYVPTNSLGEPAFTNAGTVNVDNDFFEKVNYRGAFGVNVQERWDLPWANYNPVNTEYPQVFTGVDAEIPALDRVDMRVLPNPVNESATVRFSVPATMNVTVNVYDVIGNKVMSVLENYVTNGDGIFDVQLNTAALNSGAYYVQLQTSNGSTSYPFTVKK